MAGQTTNLNQRAAVERIVRQVLAELRAAAANGTPACQPAPVQSADATLVLNSKVITAAALEGKLKNVRRLIAPRGAVFTPAARDELKRYNVSVASAVEPVGRKARPRLLVGALVKHNRESLLAGLAAESVDTVRVQALELPAAVAEVASSIGAIPRAVLITEQAALATCLANRKPPLRAAHVCRVGEIESAAGSLSPNVLVVDPTGKSVFELRQLVRHWLRHPEPVCPPALEPHPN